jgi:hypothetical protein
MLQTHVSGFGPVELSTSECSCFLREHAKSTSATAMSSNMAPIPAKRYGTGVCHREGFAKEVDETPAGVILLDLFPLFLLFFFLSHSVFFLSFSQV